MSEAATPPSTTCRCDQCGRSAPTFPPPLTWSAAVEQGARTWTCDACLRQFVRGIEGKLDPAYW